MKYSDFKEAVGSRSMHACSATISLIGDLVSAIKDVDTEHMAQLSKMIRETAKSSFTISKRVVEACNDSGEGKAMVSDVFFKMIENIADAIMDVKREKDRFDGVNNDAPSVDEINEMYGNDNERKDGDQ